MKKIFKKLAFNTFIQGGIILTAANLFGSFLNYLFNIIIARSLGPQGFGDLTALFSYLVVLTVPMSVITTLIIQKIGSSGEKRYTVSLQLEKYINAVILRYWYLFIIVLLPIPFVPRLTNLSLIAGYSLIPLLFLTILAGVYDAIFQGNRLFLTFAIIASVTTFIKLLGGIAVMLRIDGLTIALIFIFTSLVFKYITSKKILLDKSKGEGTVPILERRLINIFSNPNVWITTISLVAIYLFNNADIMYAKKFLSGYDAGLYSSWSLFAKISFYVGGPLIALSFIFFASKDQQKHHKKTLIGSLCLLTLSGIMILLAYTYFGNILINIFFGAKFVRVIPFLTQAGIFGLLYQLIFFINQYHLAQKSKYALIIALIIPIYIATLVIVRPPLAQMLTLNISFAAMLAILYAGSLIGELK